MIKIGMPYIEKNMLRSSITVEGVEKRIWISVNDEYKKYFCTERCDAFLILVLPLAMIFHHDIYCEQIVTDDILFGIEEFLLPSLTNYCNDSYLPKISANVGGALPNEQAVGTGCSGGVDSLYTMENYRQEKYSKYKLSHLLTFYMGKVNKINDAVFQSQIEEGKKIAEDYNLKYISMNSNLYDLIPVEEDNNILHTYGSMCYVLALQKLWGVYYYSSSGMDLSDFCIKNFKTISSARYEVLMFYALSTNTLKLISAGAALKRYDKINFLVDKQEMHKRLRVCVESDKNCGICPKCISTMLSIDSLGDIRAFGEVFDVKYYKEHFKYYLEWLYKRHIIFSKYINTLADSYCEYDERLWEYFKSYPDMELIKKEDKIWKTFAYVEGLYDDGWIGGKLTCISNPSSKGTIEIELYVPALTENNTISLLVDDEMVSSNNYSEGIQRIVSRVPVNKEFKWQLQFSKIVCPKKTGTGDDVRSLTAILREIKI